MKKEYDVRLPMPSLTTQLIILVSVGFFDDMYIPLAYLPQPSALYGPRFLSFAAVLRLTVPT